MRVLLSFHINSLSLEPSLRISLKRRKMIPWIQSRKYQALVFLPKISLLPLVLEPAGQKWGREYRTLLFPHPCPKRLQNLALKLMAQHPKSALIPQRNTGTCSTDSSWFCSLGNSKGVPCQALHRAGNGPPSSRAFHPRLCTPGALLDFPLVVLNHIFLLTEVWTHPKAKVPPVLPLGGSGEAQLNFPSGAQGCFPCSGILSSCSMFSGSLKHNTF